MSDGSFDTAASAAMARLALAPRLLVAVDFDGTLSRLVDHPDDARPVPGAVEALANLAGQAGTSVAVVSGRALDDLLARVDWPPEVELVGSHGVEFRSGLSVGLTPAASARRQRLISGARRLAEVVPGSVVEVKPFGVAFHYRRAREDLVEPALTGISELAAGLDDIYRLDGHAVVELGVTPITKGWALDVLRSLARATHVVYIGDDTTDEDAFAVLDETDVGVKVGLGSSQATMRVGTPDDVVELLESLSRLRASDSRV